MEINSHSSNDGIASRITNLSTSTQEVASIIRNAFEGKNSSPGNQQEVIFALSERSQAAQALSNAYRALFDGMSALIRNLRA